MAEVTKLGELLNGGEERDAIHIAVAPVVAATRLKPGQHVGFVEAGNTELVGPIADGPNEPQNRAAIGIVDPFLTVAIYPGQRFWLFLYPQTITSLRHNWTHPAFVAIPAPDVSIASTKEESEQWLRKFIAESDCPDYYTVIGAALSGGDAYWDDDHEYLHFNGQDAHGAIPEEFWRHVEVVTGQKPPHKPKYFSCSC